MLQSALAHGLDVLRDAAAGELTAWRKFRVGITRDILDSRGEPAFGRKRARASSTRAGALEWEYLPEVVPEISADHAARYDALYVNIAARSRGGRRARATAACASSRGTASATTPSTCRP